jgi:hypothetical protein
MIMLWPEKELFEGLNDLENLRSTLYPKRDSLQERPQEETAHQLK